MNSHKQKIDLSIIIVSWNTSQLLAQCLQTVQENLQICPNLVAETYVVDNASKDDSVSMVQTHFPWVQLIINQKNLGFAGGNNQVLRQTTARYVMLLNPDTEMKRGSLATLINFMEEHANIGAVGPYLLNPDGSLQLSCYPAPTLWGEFGRLFHLDSLLPLLTYRQEEWSTNEAKEVDIIKGACLLIRQEALSEVGLLDETFFMYAEEVDLCHRLKAKGWSLYWIPNAKVLHHGGQSTKQVRTEMFLRLYETKVMYFRKHHGIIGANLYKIILLAAALARLLISPFAWFEQRPQRDEHFTLANHYRLLVQHLSSF